MQPFFVRPSLSPSQTCAISNAVRPSTRPTAAKSSNADVRDNDNGVALMQKFGDFYKRFYSSISEAVVEKAHESAAMEIGDRDDICASGSILSNHGSESFRTGPTHKYQSSIEEKRGGRKFLESPSSDGKVMAEQTNSIRTTNLSSFTIPKQYSRNENRGTELSNLQYPIQSQNPTHPNGSTEEPLVAELRAEDLSRQLVGAMMRHDRLISMLEAQLKDRLRAHRLLCEKERQSNAQRIDALKTAIHQLTVHHYDPSILSVKLDEMDISLNVSEDRSLALQSPKPRYTVTDKPIWLNKSLDELLHTQPPPPHIVSRICYYIVRSYAPPDVQTYNILINGLVSLRLNSLAHMVFRTMIKSNILPDEYTVVAILNLCIKSNDPVGFWRVQRILRRQPLQSFEPHTEYGYEYRTSRMVLEVLIIGAAKFFDEKMVIRLLRSLKRNFPSSPKTSLPASTALLTLWTKKKEWVKGRDVWKWIKEQDNRWKTTGEGQPIDLRAYQAMIKLCDAFDKRRQREQILKEAAGRGFSTEAIAQPPDKHRGLWETGETKTPRVRDILTHYKPVLPREKQKGLQQVLRNAINSDLPHDMEVLVDPVGEVDDEFTGLILSSMEKRAADDRVETPFQLESSRLWDQIIFQRMNTLTEHGFTAHLSVHGRNGGTSS